MPHDGACKAGRAEDFDVTEWACRPHAWDYSSKVRSPRCGIWADVDQATQKVTRITVT
jgi:hypothetical protein